MERVVRPAKVPTADLQCIAQEQVAFPAAGHGPVAGLIQLPAPPPLTHSTPVPPFQAAGPSLIQARSDRAALRWRSKVPGFSGCFAA